MVFYTVIKGIINLSLSRMLIGHDLRRTRGHLQARNKKSVLSADTDTIFPIESRLGKKLVEYWKNRQYFDVISSNIISIIGNF